MDRQQLSILLLQNHRSFIDHISSLSNDEFLHSYNEKWTAGQQLDHIRVCVKPLTTLFALPKFVFKAMFGKANRPSKTYEELVAKYKGKLAGGVKATGRFIPRSIAADEKEELIKSVDKIAKKLSKQVNNFSEEQLDKLIIPHPVLGKLTVREMIYFTIYHVTHHHELTKQNLQSGRS